MMIITDLLILSYKGFSKDLPDYLLFFFKQMISFMLRKIMSENHRTS